MTPHYDRAEERQLQRAEAGHTGFRVFLTTRDRIVCVPSTKTTYGSEERLSVSEMAKFRAVWSWIATRPYAWSRVPALGLPDCVRSGPGGWLRTQLGASAWAPIGGTCIGAGLVGSAKVWRRACGSCERGDGATPPPPRAVVGDLTDGLSHRIPTLSVLWPSSISKSRESI